MRKQVLISDDLRTLKDDLERFNKTLSSGSLARVLFYSLCRAQPNASQLKKIFKQSATRKIVRNFATAMNLFLEQKKQNALDALPETELLQDNWYYHYFKSLCLFDLRRIDEAKAAIDVGFSVSDEEADLWHLRGAYFDKKYDKEKAIENYKGALKLDPNRAHTLSNLSAALEKAGDFLEAVEASSKAVTLNPNLLALQHNHAHILTRLGRFKDAEATYEKILTNQDTPDVSLSSYYYNQLFTDEPLTQAKINKNKRYGILFTEKFNPAEIAPRPASDRPLRIGFLSGDFKRHSCAFFIEPILKHHSGAIESVCFSAVTRPDQFTAHLSQLANEWHDISQMDDHKLTHYIRSQRVDVLLDLAGHTESNRPVPLANRVAPIQINFLGFARSSWLPTIDYRLVDWHTDPEGSDHQTSETLLRMPETFLTYQPLFGAPAIEMPPCLTKSKITFGSFNNPLKISDRIVESWCKILHQVPKSELLLKAILFRHTHLREEFLTKFARKGIAPSRITILPPTESDAAHLSSYNKIDIALDPSPYNGTTTTVEALLMGVPVITLSGDEHMSRVGTSIINNVGLSELIAKDQNDYIKIAATLAQDTDRILRYKSNIRDQLLGSPLCQHEKYVAFLERILSHLHRHHLQQHQGKRSA